MRPPPVPDNATTSTSAVVSWSPPPGAVLVIRYEVRIVIIDFVTITFPDRPSKRQTEANDQLQACLASRSDVLRDRTLSINANESSVTVTNLCELIEH